MLRHLAAKVQSGLKGGRVIISFVLVLRFIDVGTPACAREANFVSKMKHNKEMPMEVTQKQPYGAPTVKIVWVKLETNLLNVSTYDYNYHSLDED